MSATSIICLVLAAGYVLFLVGLIWFVHRYEDLVHEREQTARLLQLRRDADAKGGIEILGQVDAPWDWPR